MKELINLKATIKLTPKQITLYSFICEKLEKDEPISFEEAKELYTKHSCRNVVGGAPYYCDYYHSYNHEKKEWTSKHVPMTENMLRASAINYILRGIGTLVLKGALKITPQLQLN